MKIFKRTLILFFCLTASLYAVKWTGCSLEPEKTKKIDGKTFYIITSAEEFAWFAMQVNLGKTNINAQLANDINLTGSGWTPIGKDSSVMFNGIFDGAGLIIYGLRTWSNSEQGVGGIFGFAGKNAVIKNVKLIESSIDGVIYIGGIVAFNYGYVANCTNDGKVSDFYSLDTVSHDTVSHDTVYLGGIVGYNAGTIIACSNSSLIDSSSYKSYKSYYLGGIAGWNEGTISGCTNNGSGDFQGGIADVNKGTISGCTNNGSGDLLRGGIANENRGTINDCENYGSVKSTSSSGGITNANGGTISGCVNYGSVEAILSGGIASKNEGLINDCINRGSVCANVKKVENDAGGIVGLNTGTIVGSMNHGLVFRESPVRVINAGIAGKNKGIVSDCMSYESGLVGSDGSKAKMTNSFTVEGSIIDARNGKVTNCFFRIDDSTVTPLSGMYASEMQSDSFAWILNTTNGTAENSGVWSRDSVGYPIFADSLHLPIYKIVFNNDGVKSDYYTNYKGVVAFLENPGPLDGKKFLGWFVDDSVKVKETTVFTKDQTVYAVYCEPSSCPSEPSDALVTKLPVPTWSITVSGRNFQVHAAPVGKSFALFDLQGKVLAKGRVESPEMTLSAPRTGSYIVRIGNNSVRMNAR